jgi:hypothetical protein
MRTRSLLIAVAAGMTLAASALGAGPLTAGGMQVSQVDQTGRLAGAVTGAEFDRETKSIAQSLKRGEIAIDTESPATSQGAGAAGSPGQMMGRGGQLTDTGSAWFDGYVGQVNRHLRLAEPAFH